VRDTRVTGLVDGRRAEVLYAGGRLTGHPIVLERVARLIDACSIVAEHAGEARVATLEGSPAVIAATLMAGFDEVHAVAAVTPDP
jgi:hypothetical protein